ncbi:MAG: hypothetical protein IT184_16425 [Acidobacteria bacterium]|nr:hypothetical protein [Acidobacteriota bacterium]
MRTRPSVAVVLSLAILAGSSSALSAQVVLDRILTRINGQIVTQSDVDRARLLKLVDDPSSDATARKGLEDRILVLGEIARLPPLAVSEQDLAARRAEWEAAIGGPEAAAALQGRTAMSDGALRAWLRDDVRIGMYLARQFGQVSERDRANAVADWIGRLRQRAGVK